MLKMMNTIYLGVFLVIFLHHNGSIYSFKNFQSSFIKNKILNKQLFPSNDFKSETEKLFSSTTNLSK